METDLHSNEQKTDASKAPAVVAVVATVVIVIGGVLLALAILKPNIEFLKDTPFSSARSESAVNQTKAEDKAKNEPEAETKMTAEKATEQLKSAGYAFIANAKVYRDEGFENCGKGPDYHYLYFVVLDDSMNVSATRFASVESYTMKTGILCKGDDFSQYEFTSKVQDFENCIGKDVVIGFKDADNIKLGSGGGTHGMHMEGVGSNYQECVLYNYGTQVCHIKAYELIAVE